MSGREAFGFEYFTKAYCIAEREGLAALTCPGRNDALQKAPHLTLVEARMVLANKNFPNAATIISQLVALPNVSAVAFGERHYYAAEKAFDLFGKGRHSASLNMGDCYSYAVAAIAKAPLLFKGHEFGQTDLKLHPSSSQ